MKLATRYFRINALATTAIFLLAGTAFYFLLWFIMIGQVDEDLKIEQREIESYIAEYRRPPESIIVKDQRSSYEPTTLHTKIREFATIISNDRHEPEDFREIRFTEKLGDQWLFFRVSKSLEAVEHMNRSIIIISVLTITLILFVTLFINRLLFRKLWQPFYDTLKGLSLFRLGEKKSMFFGHSPIDEFNLLNSSLGLFIENADREYTGLKEFTENASHELQTPLAIVRSKLDVLIQDENLTETQGNAAASAYDALKRMIRLNHSLLLLTKIENRQFDISVEVDMKSLIKQKLVAYQELFHNKEIHVVSSLEPTLIIMNTELTDILLNNLFSNAIRHSMSGETININLRNNRFVISNKGDGGPLNPDQLFKRFAKSEQSTDHHGLGLSIVQQICAVSGWKAAYHFEKGFHHFTIDFVAS